HQYEAMYAMDTQDAFRSMNGVEVLRLPWGAFFSAHFIQPLRKLRPNFYRVRPMRNYLVWAFLFETRFFFSVIFQFIRMLFLALRKRVYPGDSLWKIFAIFSHPAGPEALEEYAEVLLASDTTQKVIFGHTRLPSYLQFQNGKEYFNCGTWTRNLSLD